MSADGSRAPALEVQGLVKAYGGVRAIDGLDLAVEAGELHCIIGPNGAGKSTLFKLVIGTERPSAGTVLYRGRAINALKSFERARASASRSSFRTFRSIRTSRSSRTCSSRFAATIGRRRFRHRFPTFWAPSTSAAPRANSSPASPTDSSNGWRSACRWPYAPKVLLLDEPTAGMSPEETRETAQIVRGLNAAGVTVIVIEHDMEFVRNLNSRTTVLHYGKVFAQGTFGEIESDANVRRIYLGSVQEGP